jgi:hypothetical protein
VLLRHVRPDAPLRRGPDHGPSPDGDGHTYDRTISDGYQHRHVERHAELYR